ncbi:MAG: hypothetical protein RR585_15800 [Coprobacillus sp.]
MNKQEIIKEAVHSYETHFKDAKEVVQHDFDGKDVALDKNKLMKDVEMKKVQTLKKHESLDLLKDKLIVEAEDSLEKTFGKKASTHTSKKLSTEEMYEELKANKQHLSETTGQLKQKQLSKMNH